MISYQCKSNGNWNKSYPYATWSIWLGKQKYMHYWFIYISPEEVTEHCQKNPKKTELMLWTCKSRKRSRNKIPSLLQTNINQLFRNKKSFIWWFFIFLAYLLQIKLIFSWQIFCYLYPWWKTKVFVFKIFMYININSFCLKIILWGEILQVILYNVSFFI